MSTSVESYAPAPDAVLDYPFRRPEGSFLTDGTSVFEMPNELEAFRVKSDEMLLRAGLSPIEERIPVISYGSNSNPDRLRKKMTAYGDSNVSAELQTVPNILATIPDTVIAWHGKPGQTGRTFAELYKGKDTVGESSQAHISFLTPLQVALMHASEGVTYHFAQVQTLVATNKTPMTAYAYVAGSSEVLVKDGSVVPVKRPGETGADGALSAEQAVDYMVQHANGAVPSQTARELIKEMDGLPLPERKAKQAAVSEALGNVGLNKKFSFPTDGFFLRGDFKFKEGDPIQLLEQTLEPLRPTDPNQRNTGTDIATVMRKRAHAELFAK